MKRLIQAGATFEKIPQLDPKSRRRTTNSLEMAIMRGHTECVAILLSHPRTRGMVAEPTSLHVACEYGHIEIVTLLANAGVDVNVKIKGQTPLDVACGEGHDAVRHAPLAIFVLPLWIPCATMRKGLTMFFNSPQPPRSLPQPQRKKSGGRWSLAGIPIERIRV